MTSWVPLCSPASKGRKTRGKQTQNGKIAGNEYRRNEPRMAQVLKQVPPCANTGHSGPLFPLKPLDIRKWRSYDPLQAPTPRPAAGKDAHMASPDIENSDPTKTLVSWKEIAVFLNHSESTVKRWERDRGLPVHRIPGGERGGVFAYSDELADWLKGKALELEADGSASQRSGDSWQRLRLEPRARARLTRSRVRLPAEAAGWETRAG